MKFWSVLAVTALMLGTLAGCTTTTYDGTPAPHDGNIDYVVEASTAGTVKAVDSTVSNVGYHFFRTNGDRWPYDTFGDQLSRDWTTFNRTWDLHLLNYDWDDPYVD